MIAREAGLEPLADLFADPTPGPARLKPAPSRSMPAMPALPTRMRCSTACATCSNAGPKTPCWSASCASGCGNTACSSPGFAMDGKEQQPDVAKFRDYFDYAEPIRTVPSHRALAVFRGRTQELLDAKLVLDEEARAGASRRPGGSRIAIPSGWRHANRPADELIRKTVAWTWKVKLSLSLERDLFARLREEAEATPSRCSPRTCATCCCARRPPRRHGPRPRHPHRLQGAGVSTHRQGAGYQHRLPARTAHDWEGSLHTSGRLCATHGVNLIAIGNGTASRETDKLAADLIKRIHAMAPGRRSRRSSSAKPAPPVYSASEFASQGTAGARCEPARRRSIARACRIPRRAREDRPQEHRRGPVPARRQPERAGEEPGRRRPDCVNSVGVDLNTASAPCCRASPVSGAWRRNRALARRQRRLPQPPAAARRDGLGPKTFEQSPASASARRQPARPDRRAPETYPVVERMLAQVKARRGDGPQRRAQASSPKSLCRRALRCHHRQGHPGELEKPGRDPRPRLQVARFNDGVGTSDLQPGMTLEGTVSNVAQFGAFVDLGVHPGRPGAREPAVEQVRQRRAQEVVKTGDIVKVKVLEVDLARKRISLTMKLDAKPGGKGERGDKPSRRGAASGPAAGRAELQPQGQSAMAAAFAKLQGAAERSGASLRRGSMQTLQIHAGARALRHLREHAPDPPRSYRPRCGGRPEGAGAQPARPFSSSAAGWPAARRPCTCSALVGAWRMASAGADGRGFAQMADYVTAQSYEYRREAPAPTTTSAGGWRHLSERFAGREVLNNRVGGCVVSSRGRHPLLEKREGLARRRRLPRARLPTNAA